MDLTLLLKLLLSLIWPWNTTTLIDLGSPNCERMTPIKFAEYVQEYFKSQSVIKTSVIEDINVIEKEYPLLHAVARCSLSGMCLFISCIVHPPASFFVPYQRKKKKPNLTCYAFVNKQKNIILHTPHSAQTLPSRCQT